MSTVARSPQTSPPTRASLALLASDRLRVADDLDAVALTDRARRGAVAVRVRPGLYRRAEAGSSGPLVYEAARREAHVEVEVWGCPSTKRAKRERAMHDARGWVGWYDDPPDLVALTAGHPLVHQAARRIGVVRLSRMPRVHEAVGRAVLGQLVQGIEARRSTAQLAAAIGQPTIGDLWCWPTPTQTAHTPAHVMRRCGISLRCATALHASAMDDPQLERVRTDVVALDRRLRALPGIGVWTSAETRLALGDPDAVSIGDDNLYETVCHGLAGTPQRECSDELMLELLEPWPGQRGRVIQLVVRAVRRGLLPRLRRRAPRAALSQHRYW